MDLSWAPSVPKSMWMLSSLTQVRRTGFGFKSNTLKFYHQDKNVDALKQETVVPSSVPLACMSVTFRRDLRLGFKRFQLCSDK